MASCSNGHDSEWEDYCSVCGESLGEASASAGEEAPDSASAESDPATEASPELGEAGLSCPNCSETYAAGDVFCENCGYDFLSGTLPEEVVPQVPAGGSSGRAIVTVDLEFFERMKFSGVEPPAELPEPLTVVLPPTDILVGRQSDTRGTFPEIDLDDDPAVSSSHCRLHRGANGWTVTDLDSTNGTFLGDDPDPLTPGRAMILAPGTAIYVGAWTKIELVD